MSEDTTGTITAFVASDGTLHLTAEARDLHDEAVKLAPMIRDFIDYGDYKGRSKKYLFEVVRDFMRWNKAGRPKREAPAPEAAPEAAPAEAPAA